MADGVGREKLALSGKADVMVSLRFRNYSYGEGSR